MTVQELLSHKLTDQEINISDTANRILDAFNGSYKPHCFLYTRFHTNSSNDPEGFRIIYVKNKGFTLVNGDGDKGLGWIIDGVSYSENLNRAFYKKRIYPDIESGDKEVGFIFHFEEFLNYTLKNVFHSNFTSEDIFNNDSVKKILASQDDFQKIYERK